MENPKSVDTEKQSDLLIEKINSIIDQHGRAGVAKAMGVPLSKLQYLGRGGGLSLDTIVKLSKVLKIDWNDEFYGDQNKDLISLPAAESEVDKSAEIERLKKEVENKTAIEKELIETKAKLEVYQELMSNVIPFRKTLNEDEMTAKMVKSFSETSEEAPVYSLNFDGVDYHPVRRIGFAPSYLENADSLVKNA